MKTLLKESFSYIIHYKPFRVKNQVFLRFFQDFFMLFDPLRDTNKTTRKKGENSQ